MLETKHAHASRGCHRLTSPRIESGSLVFVNMAPCKGLMFPEVRNSPKLENVVVPEGCRLEWQRTTTRSGSSTCPFPQHLLQTITFTEYTKRIHFPATVDLMSVDRILGCDDYYDMLGLCRDATLQQITKQYRTVPTLCVDRLLTLAWW